MSIKTSILISISNIGLFWQDKINGQIFRWNILFLVISLIVLFLKFNNLPPQIPLYYSLPWGANQLASVTSIFILPISSIIILLINNLLAVFFTKSVRLISLLLIITSAIYSLFATISLIQIIYLVS